MFVYWQEWLTVQALIGSSHGQNKLCMLLQASSYLLM